MDEDGDGNGEYEGKYEVSIDDRGSLYFNNKVSGSINNLTIDSSLNVILLVQTLMNSRTDMKLQILYQFMIA